MEKSTEALKILIAGESNAVKTYELFSLKAYEEGFGNIGLLFDVLSKAERIHVKNHIHALENEFVPELNDVSVQSTMENLKTAIAGETEESRHMYPRLIKYIKSENGTEFGKVAKLSMTWALKVEKEHAKLLKMALKALKSGNDLTLKSIFLCQVCGNMVINDLTDNVCTVCGHDRQFFSEMGAK